MGRSSGWPHLVAFFGLLLAACAQPEATLAPTPSPTLTPAPTLGPTPTPTSVAAVCLPALPPATVSPGPAGLYRGPLFDSHLHLLRPVLRTRFESADAVCRYLEKDQVMWAIGFFQFPPTPDPEAVRTEALIGGARSRIVALLQPAAGPPGFAALAEGQYTETRLRSYLQPQGLLRGVGEIPVYRPELEAFTLDSPQMQTVFRVVDEMKGIVMIHPRPWPSDLAAMEMSRGKYPNITILVHSGDEQVVGRVILPLMDKYPNVYYSYDMAGMFYGPFGNLMFPEPRGSGSAEGLVAEVNRVGADRILQHGLRALLPLLQRHPDRVLWGTDRAQPWHFDEPATELIIQMSRQLIARLPADAQEAYAFRNALRVFGRYLSPSP